MDGSIIFARWRQCVLPWGHIGATWRIWLKLCILRPTWVQNPNGKSMGSAVIAQLTAESAYTLQLAPLSTRIAPSNGRIWIPYVRHDSLGPCEPKTQKPKLHIDLDCCNSRECSQTSSSSLRHTAVTVLQQHNWQWHVKAVIFSYQTHFMWLGSLVVRALDLRLDGCKFDSRPLWLILDGWPSAVR